MADETQQIKETDSKIKHCSFCGEEILVSAVKCKHCKEWLDKEHVKEPKERVGVPKCPTCGSTGVERISAGDIARTMLLFGSLKNLTGTFKCNTCGHKW